MKKSIDPAVKIVMKETLHQAAIQPSFSGLRAEHFITSTWSRLLWECKKIAQRNNDPDAHRMLLSWRGKIYGHPVYRYLDEYEEELPPVLLHYIRLYVQERTDGAEPTPEEWAAITRIYETGLADIREYCFKYFIIKPAEKGRKHNEQHNREILHAKGH